MFGMGGSEILVILIVALLFLGPDKLPEAAKQISKGIRDIKRQSRALQQTIEDDEHIGGAIRDLRSALRGEDAPIRPRPAQPKQIEALPAPDPLLPAALPISVEPALADGAAAPVTGDELPVHTASSEGSEAAPASSEPAGAAPGVAAAAATITLPPVAGEPDDAAPRAEADAADLAALVKPAPNTIARGSASAAPAGTSGPKHG